MVEKEWEYKRADLVSEKWLTFRLQCWSFETLILATFQSRNQIDREMIHGVVEDFVKQDQRSANHLPAVIVLLVHFQHQNCREEKRGKKISLTFYSIWYGYGSGKKRVCFLVFVRTFRAKFARIPYVGTLFTASTFGMLNCHFDWQITSHAPLKVQFLFFFAYFFFVKTQRETCNFFDIANDFRCDHKKTSFQMFVMLFKLMTVLCWTHDGYVCGRNASCGCSKSNWIRAKVM